MPEAGPVRDPVDARLTWVLQQFNIVKLAQHRFCRVSYPGLRNAPATQRARLSFCVGASPPIT